MPYVIDSDILIRANRHDFPLSTGHHFWAWFAALGERGIVIVPEMVFNEVLKGNDALADWIKANKEAFFCPTIESLGSIGKVLAAYEVVTDVALESMNADPFVIAHALACGGTVITNELANNATAARNKKIPNICAKLEVPCFTMSQFLWELRTI